MAHIWQTDGLRWVRQALAGNYFGMRLEAAAPIQPAAYFSPEPTIATLARYDRPGQGAAWVLLGDGRAGIRVNGHCPLGGLTLLRDRDEILLGDWARFYFTTEELAKIEPFPGSTGPVFCARCRQPVGQGTPAVCCPSCGHWCEQSDEKPCWSYGPTCPMCAQPTAFDAGLRWSPEEL